MSIGGPWDEDPLMRLRSDKAPTLGGSPDPDLSSHESLSGLDHRSDNWKPSAKAAFAIAVVLASWGVVSGVVGGVLYLSHIFFGWPN